MIHHLVVLLLRNRRSNASTPRTSPIGTYCAIRLTHAPGSSAAIQSKHRLAFLNTARQNQMANNYAALNHAIASRITGPVCRSISRMAAEASANNPCPGIARSRILKAILKIRQEHAHTPLQPANNFHALVTARIPHHRYGQTAFQSKQEWARQSAWD